MDQIALLPPQIPDAPQRHSHALSFTDWLREAFPILAND